MSRRVEICEGADGKVIQSGLFTCFLFGEFNVLTSLVNAMNAQDSE